MMVPSTICASPSGPISGSDGKSLGRKAACLQAAFLLMIRKARTNSSDAGSPADKGTLPFFS